MRRILVLGAVALASVSASSGIATAASTPKVIPGATYQAKGTKVVVDATGTEVRVLALPVHAQCKGDAPENEGDYGSTGLGPFGIGKDGSFSNLEPGQQAGSAQAVIKGRFAGATVSGSVVEPAFTDKGFDSAKFSGTWHATRVKGTGDDTKAGAVYAKDDFSKPKSGFEVYNESGAYAEYLPDSRFRIGTRQPTGATSLRTEPTTATADISVTTGFTSGSDGDGAGLACLGSDATTFIAGYVSLDGYAYLVHYAAGDVAESATPKALPAGLLRAGDQAQNEVRLVCEPSTDAAHTNLYLYVNGTEVSNAEAGAGGAGQVGLFVASNSGTSEFTFSDFSVRKPKA